MQLVCSLLRQLSQKEKKSGFKIMPLRLWLGFSIIGYKYEALEGNYCEI